MRTKKAPVKIAAPQARKINGSLIFRAEASIEKAGFFDKAKAKPALKLVRFTPPREQAGYQPQSLWVSAVTGWMPNTFSLSGSYPITAVTISRDDADKLIDQAEQGHLYFVVVDKKP